MEPQIDRLVRKTWEKYEQTPISKRLLIGISGIPGSGRSTPALALAPAQWLGLITVQAHRSPASACTYEAVHVSMDGYHYSRAQLSTMPNPSVALARRGAAFTFDAQAYLQLVRDLRKPLAAESKTLFAPSFDHAVKDPVENDIHIEPTARIVILEGNYLSLAMGEWKEASDLMDELWFVEVSFEEARKRLVERHMRTGIAENEEAARKRADANDLVNGKEIVEGRVKVHEVIFSMEDDAWRVSR